MTLLLTRTDLEKVLDAPSVIEAVQQGCAEYSAGKAHVPVRSSLHGLDMPGTLLVMPCALGESHVLGTKFAGVYPANPARGLSTIEALYVLFDYETGVPLAVMDANFMTGIRTAAASAVATRYLAREEAATLGIFGTGTQAEWHALLLPLVRPIKRIVVWGHSPEKTEAFVARMQPRCPVTLGAAQSPEEAVVTDIVVTATTTSEPLFPAAWLRPGTHINAVGSHTPTKHELASDVVKQCDIIVDAYDVAFAEAGDLLLAMEEGKISREDIRAELGEIILGSKAGRQHEFDITLFKSCGVAFEDAICARLAFERARDAGLGRSIDFSG